MILELHHFKEIYKEATLRKMKMSNHKSGGKRGEQDEIAKSTMSPWIQR